MLTLHMPLLLRFVLFGMFCLVIGASVIYDNPAETPIWVVALPLGYLSLVLCYAIVTRPRIYRNPGLLIFHVSLLSLVLLAGFGYLARFSGNLELAEDESFSTMHLTKSAPGPLHRGDLAQLRFMQGPFTVAYAAGMRRGQTQSWVKLADAQGQWRWQALGDDRPLRLRGYRFYTTPNKGFAPVLTWIADDPNMPAIRGAMHFPAYPLQSDTQQQQWRTPLGQSLHFSLQLKTALDPAVAWTLQKKGVSAILVVKDGDRIVNLRPGQEARFSGGRLRYEKLSMWMGYEVFYDPTLHYLFFVSIFGVFGLAWHLMRKIRAIPMPSPSRRMSTR